MCLASCASSDYAPCSDYEAQVARAHSWGASKGKYRSAQLRTRQEAPLRQWSGSTFGPDAAGLAFLPPGHSVHAALRLKSFPGSCPLFRTMHGFRCQGTRPRKEPCHQWSVGFVRLRPRVTAQKATIGKGWAEISSVLDFWLNTKEAMNIQGCNSREWYKAVGVLTHFQCRLSVI